MCTLTWQFTPDNSGYSLYFNRDELKTRQRALPPQQMQSSSGTQYLAPIDTDAGGSWLVVNQYGLTLCLLNNYVAAEPTFTPLKSRGDIVIALADCRSTQEVEMRLKAMDLRCFRGFDVVAIQHEIARWCWDTFTLENKAAEMPMTSSSYDTLRVCDTRRQYFESLANTDSLEVLEEFHSSHLDDDLCPVSAVPVTANSVCMHRQDAQTVSQCFVQVNTHQVSMVYTDGSPCENKAMAPLVLQRQAAAA